MNAPANIRVDHPNVTAASGKYKLSVRDYLLLDEAGSFGGAETELVDGDVIVMSPEWIPHMRIKDELSYRLRGTIERLQIAAVVGTGGSVELSETDQPRPDIIIARRFSGDKAVSRDDVLLLIEIASTTLPFDLREKALTYARAEVPEYWVVDVNGRVVHQMDRPGEGGYADVRRVAFGQPLTSATIPELTIATDAI
jgi:Uma2 family endonuclease